MTQIAKSQNRNTKKQKNNAKSQLFTNDRKTAKTKKKTKNKVSSTISNNSGTSVISANQTDSSLTPPKSKKLKPNQSNMATQQQPQMQQQSQQQHQQQATAARKQQKSVGKIKEPPPDICKLELYLSDTGKCYTLVMPHKQFNLWQVLQLFENANKKQKLILTSEYGIPPQRVQRLGAS